MKEIGSYEAKTHLPRLLKEVEEGEEFLIKRRGVPIAELIPVRGSTEDLEALHREIIKKRSKQKSVTLQEILAWKHEGHRF